MKIPKEKEVQKTILDYLYLNKWYAFKIGNVGIFNQKTGSYIPAQTVGLPDIVAIKNGRVVTIEVKRAKGGKQSDGQLLFQHNWEQHGGTYILGGLDDVIKKLDAKNTSKT